MSFNQQNRNENERDKFEEGSDGKPVVRFSLKDGINLSEGSVLEVKDHRGFVIFSVDEVTGNVSLKGEFVKI